MWQTTSIKGARTSERLFRVLEAYGADPARWPENERQDLLRLCAGRDPAMEEALKAARELDAILAAAGRPALDVEAARDRFLSSASRQRRRHRRHRRSISSTTEATRMPFAPRGACHGRHSGALAASLAAGLYVGAGGMAHEFIPALVAGEASEEELWSPAIFGDDAVSIEDEQ